MPTPSARRADCTLYEVDTRSGETVEIFCADTVRAVIRRARRGLLLAKTRLLARPAEWSVHYVLRCVLGCDALSVGADTPVLCSYFTTHIVNVHSRERLTNKKSQIMCQACDMDTPLLDDTA
jgi:hypothetical protein